VLCCVVYFVYIFLYDEETKTLRGLGKIYPVYDGVAQKTAQCFFCIRKKAVKHFGRRASQKNYRYT
jgi:hypothetical protein